MSTPSRWSTDIRVVSASLAVNQTIVLPDTIAASGRATVNQFAVVPAGTTVSFALQPTADYDDAPDLRPGGGFRGGRNASIVAYLDHQALAVMSDVKVTIRQLPTSRTEIGWRLRGDAGLHWAPGTVFSLAGWEDEWVYVWLDHLRQDDIDARLVIAHAQAMLAIRKMWLRVVWDVGVSPTSTVAGPLPSLATQCGAVAVGRAIIDVAHILLRQNNATRAARMSIAPSAKPMATIRSLLEQYIRLVAAADSRGEVRSRKNLDLAIKKARDIMDAIAVFSVGAEPLFARWRRLDDALPDAGGIAAAPLTATDFAAFDTRLNQLVGADLGKRLESTVWRRHVRVSLLRLASPNSAVRLARLDRVRCDLIFKLAITRRPDRLYRLFPWLAAPHRAFFNCAGGALGAFASLIECARRMDIARELKRQLIDADPTRSVAVMRLTIPAAKHVWASHRRMYVAAARGYAAGIALEANTISHATMNALFNGAYFGPKYPLTELRFGRLGWALPVALKDPRTIATVQRVEQSRPIMAMKPHDDDLPRHLGMTLKRLLAETIVSVFTNTAQRSDGQAHREQAIAAAKRLRPKCNHTRQPLYDATQQLHRSMLQSLDAAPGTDPQWRDAIADRTMSPTVQSVEVDRVETLQSTSTPKNERYHSHDDGQGLRRDATNEATITDGRGALLRELADDDGRWRPPGKPVKKKSQRSRSGKPPKPSRYAGPPRDDLLEDILLGRVALNQLTPIGALAIPILWFAPMIDSNYVGWLGRGAPARNAPPGPATQRKAIASQVAKARAWAPLLYSKAMLTVSSVRVTCHLFTGHSPVTADLSHA